MNRKLENANYTEFVLTDLSHLEHSIPCVLALDGRRHCKLIMAVLTFVTRL